MTMMVCGLSRIAGAEDFLSKIPSLPHLGTVVALALHGQMDIVGRALRASGA
jgi:hypothetical protein